MKTLTPSRLFAALILAAAHVVAAPAAATDAEPSSPAASASLEPPVDYVVRDAASIPEPLVDLPPGLLAGGAVVFNRAGCAECHRVPGRAAAAAADQQDGGEVAAVGPDLDGVGERLTEGEIRLMIADPRIPLPKTEMPAYYAVGVFGAAPDELVGRTRLSAADVERLVEWLGDQ